MHHISLPPERFQGDAVERLFTNSLDHAAHPWFERLRGARVSAHLLVRRHGVDPAVAAEVRDQFPVPQKLWTLADLGGWPSVDTQLFDKKSGSITKIYTKATG